MRAVAVLFCCFVASATTVQAEDDDDFLSCECPDVYDPVCGSDGITYQNLCRFNCVQELVPDLEIVHYGEC
ncbi:unnamed protein product [Allacma fusca]|uniref:Kazal-like domain-containing protein n=1 Tax=Allacma fusca TaxID=39272 RepID=A0A8J2P6M7_9HEXA|nr:unnamed protein product [Allacma fusca]